MESDNKIMFVVAGKVFGRFFFAIKYILQDEDSKAAGAKWIFVSEKNCVLVESLLECRKKFLLQS